MKWLRYNFQPCLPLGSDGTRISGSPEHIALSREAAREGIVLLKNENNALPLQRGQKVALLGKASEEYIKGGGGSGDVSCAYVRNLYDSMTEKEADGKIHLYHGLHEFYQEDVAAQHVAGAAPGMTRECVLTDMQLREAAAFSDTAIVSICRFSGEGWDRHCAQEEGIQAMETGCGEDDLRQAGKNVFARGDFYLSQEEEQLIKDAKKHFSRIIVVLNVGGMVDTAWFAGDPAIGAVLFAGQGGMEGAMAIGDILCGDANPCGCLVDTFAASLESYPSTASFHESEDYVAYTEDIYVGYRYFETIPGKLGDVVYPFGFGLSYTTFQTEITHCEITDALHCTAAVTNTGRMAGKQILQMYFSAPDGKLGKPKMQLAAFEKTPLLQPGETAELGMTISLDAMASYDDLGAVQKSAWVLEKGTYRFFIGSSVRAVQELPVCHVQAEDRTVRQLTEKLKPYALPKRMLSDGSYQTLECSKYPEIPRPVYMDNPVALEGIMPETRPEKRRIFPWSPLAQKPAPQLEDVAEGKMTLDAFLDTLSVEEQVWLLGGQPNTGVANTFGMGGNRDRGIPAIMTADGPAGLRLHPELGVYTTAWPCATTLACTWNRELMGKIGAAAAQEVKENNIGIWLAPALNIHRSPLCGRNFEYYSEDPFIAGEMGAAIVEGIQSQGIAATPKHFAFNNKETKWYVGDGIYSDGDRFAMDYYNSFVILPMLAELAMIFESTWLLCWCLD